ncbi:hypoxanthine phosphoribosyltransferase [Methylopila musalis]|uniref:Hypoxanthine phosphoribosyltransferase n=1 Tax=Methylopila musalis TaxID=1134781 RepID=A0ABW3ZAK1_9HYPH
MERRLTVLYDAETIARRNAGLASEIAAIAPERLLAIVVLKGSFVFAADLIRAMHEASLAPEIEFLSLSSYLDGTVSSGTVRIVHDIESEVAGRDVLLIDDILESGRTLAYAKDLMAARGARRVLTCVLLEKPGKRAVSVAADFTGFVCPDVFVVGYGMDVAHAYRQLPFVGVVEVDGHEDRP